MRGWTVPFVLGALGAGSALSGCGGTVENNADSGGTQACTPGRVASCPGPGGCSGSQTCRADGSGFGACTCADGKPDSSSGTTTDASPDSRSDAPADGPGSAGDASDSPQDSKIIDDGSSSSGGDAPVDSPHDSAADSTLDAPADGGKPDASTDAASPDAPADSGGPDASADAADAATPDASTEAGVPDGPVDSGGVDASADAPATDASTPCGRFASGFTGSWSTVASSPYSLTIMSGYLPSTGTATIYVGAGTSFDSYDAASDSYSALLSPPDVLDGQGSVAWLNGYLWTLAPALSPGGYLLRYDVTKATWSAPGSSLVLADHTQTASDEGGNLWGYQDNSTVIQIDTLASPIPTPYALSTAIGGSYPRIVLDSCSDLLYLAGDSALPFYSFDPASSTQTTLSALPGLSNFSTGFCGDKSGRVYAIASTSTVYEYTIATDTWSALPAAPGALNGGSAMCGVGADGYLYATDPNTGPAVYKIRLK